MIKFRLSVFFFIPFVLCTVKSCAQPDKLLPRLIQANGVTQLYVKGKPFLILGGELGNSTASDMDYMRPAWSKLKLMHLNTVLTPVYWELLEPARRKIRLHIGRQYDFRSQKT